MGLTLARSPRIMQEFAVAEVAQHPQGGIAMIAVIGAAVLAMLVDGTSSAAITAGLPYISGLAAATPDESSWVVTAFNAPYYATILLSPWLYARFGRTPLLLAGMFGYALLSTMLVFASSYELIVVLRFFQGMLLGCVFVPVVILLFTSLPLGGLRFAIPGFAFLVLTASAIGTLTGGFLTENYGANALYIPGIIAIAIAGVLVWRYAPRYDHPQPNLRFDMLGYVLSLLAFGAAQYLTNEGERRNWLDDGSVVIAFVVLIFSVAALLIWELALSRQPHAKLRLFTTYRNLAVGSAINVILGAVGYSVTLFSLYLQGEIASTITLAGEVIALRVITYALGIIVAFLLISQRIVDVRVVLIFGAVGSAFALYGFAHAMTATAEARTFVLLSLAFGFVFAMLSQPVPALVIGALPLPDLPNGLAIYKLTSPIGLMIGTCFFSWFVDHRVAYNAYDLASSINLARSSTVPFPGVNHAALVKVSAVILQQAQDLGERDAMMFIAALVLLTIPIILCVVPPTPRPTQ